MNDAASVAIIIFCIALAYLLFVLACHRYTRNTESKIEKLEISIKDQEERIDEIDAKNYHRWSDVKSKIQLLED